MSHGPILSLLFEIQNLQWLIFSYTGTTFTPISHPLHGQVLTSPPRRWSAGTPKSDHSSTELVSPLTPRYPGGQAPSFQTQLNFSGQSVSPAHYKGLSGHKDPMKSDSTDSGIDVQTPTSGGSIHGGYLVPPSNSTQQAYGSVAPQQQRDVVGVYRPCILLPQRDDTFLVLTWNPC